MTAHDVPYVVTATGCHETTLSKTTSGYGQVRRGRWWRAHRYVWTVVNGPIPDGVIVLHRCDNPPCINPDHLFLGTHADNVADKIAKGRGRRFVTHCNRGHELTDDNVYVHPKDGKRETQNVQGKPMTTGYGFRIDLADTPESLQAAWDNPDTRWYARKRLRVLAATGALVAVGGFEALHPRGRDGKFIDKFGWVRWLDPKTLKWNQGWVKDINPQTGELSVRQGGETKTFPNANNLYAQPKRKAVLKLPDVVKKVIPEGWKKSGSQGGSNPGGFFTRQQGAATDSPDLGPRTMLPRALASMTAPDSKKEWPWGGLASPAESFGGNANVAVVPRLDGTKDRQDVLFKFGPDWYRVPAKGSMVDPDTNLMRDDLKVSAIDAFGEQEDKRRLAVLGDKNAQMFNLDDEYNMDDLAQMVQGVAGNPADFGDEYYVKTMPLADRANNEALANHLYEMLGVPVPEVSIGSDGVTVASKIVPGKLDDFDWHNPAHVKEAQKHFVADVFLANWDVIGQNFDNVKVDAHGTVWRIDAGGALAWRAMGKPKGSKFGPTVGELASLSDPSMNPTAGTVFGGIPQAELQDQARMLEAITPTELYDLANEFGMPELGPTLVARRQSVLDQLGVKPPVVIPEPEPVAPYPTPTGLEHVYDVSTPGQVAVSNYGIAFENLSTTNVGSVEEWESQSGTFNMQEMQALVTSAVFTRSDGDLMTYHSEFKFDPGLGEASFLATNLMNGKVEPMSVDSYSKLLVNFQRDDQATDDLVDELMVSRSIATDEIVAHARTADSLDAAMQKAADYTDIDALTAYQLGVPNFDGLAQAWERGQLGPTGPEGSTGWPIRSGDALYEIVGFNPDDGVRLRRRDSYDPKEFTVGPAAFNTMDWTRPGNDTTAELWKSRYAEDVNVPDTPDIKHQTDEKAKLDPSPDEDSGNWWGGPNTPDSFAQTDEEKWSNGNEAADPDAGVEVEGYDTQADFDKALADWEAKQQGQANPFESEVAAHQADEMGAAPKVDVTPAITNDEDAAQEVADAIPAQLFEWAQPTTSVKTVHNVVDGLGAGTPILSTDYGPEDLEDLKAQLMGKTVVVLPIEAHDNPDWVPTDLGYTNGVGKVLNVTLTGQWVKDPANPSKNKYMNVPTLTLTDPSGSNYGTRVIFGDTKFQKMIVPVEHEMIPQKPTFKGDGTIWVNGQKVGTYENDIITVDGDFSVTGKAMQFTAYQKKNMRIGVSKLVKQIPPKPVKPKSTKEHVTADELKALNDNLYDIKAQISAKELEIAGIGTPAAVPVGDGVPLNDGHIPSKGDWVFSTKDGVYAQIAGVNVTATSKGAAAANYVRVEYTNPVTGKKVSGNRQRSTLVSAAGPGEKPFVMETKAMQDSGGHWYGPGSTHVAVNGIPGEVMVLDTTVDGKVKVKTPDGKTVWVDKKGVFAAGGDIAEEEGIPVPTIKPAAGSKPDADKLNSELAALQDAQSNLAAQIANTTVKKPSTKKAVGNPYPGPDGKLIKQPAYVAEQREAKGLKNLKDGNAPVPGQVLRHNDGSQWVVVEVGPEWQDSRKNSVNVIPVGGGWQPKWKAVSTMVVDHEAMLSNENGVPLPVVNNIEGLSWVPPVNGVVWRKDQEKTYHVTDAAGNYVKDPDSPYGGWLMRTKTISSYYIVAPEGTVYDVNGTSLGGWSVQNALWGANRVAYIDNDHQGPGAMTMTMSMQTHQGSKSNLQYAVIHDPADSPAVVLAAQHPDVVPAAKPAKKKVVKKPPITEAVQQPSPESPTVGPAPEGYVYNPLTGIYEPEGGTAPDVVTDADTSPETLPAPPATPAVPNVTPLPTPMDEALPVFTGKSPVGTELPHPKTVTSSQSVQVPQRTGGTNLDVVSLPGAHSVQAAIDDTLSKAETNRKEGKKDWVSTYGIADHDAIEDMMVQTTLAKDAKGVDYIEVEFRVEKDVASKNHNKFMTSSKNEIGDWSFANRNSKNMVPGDQLAVRVSAGGGVHAEGALKPDGDPTKGDSGKTPNATVIAAPVLLNTKSKNGYDIYRTQVMTTSGDIGWIDLEDRGGADTVITAYWDDTKQRTTNGNKSLNANAANDGWKLASSSLGWDRAGAGHQVSEQDEFGVKKVGGQHKEVVSGTGFTLERDIDGAMVQYQTSSAKNSNKGRVLIRVRADDPEAQRKISEAMEVVGVSAEKQAPPDRDAIIMLGAQKVFEQFNSTYSPQNKINSIDEALGAIDKAVGKNMPKGPDGKPRKATIDDISVKVHPDGRLQFLVSEDVSRAIVATNGVKAYTHSFQASKAGESITANIVIAALSGENPGLQSTTERWKNGLFFQGKSSHADHGHDSADNMFLSMNKGGMDATTRAGVVIDPVTMHRHLDYYWQPDDAYGDRQSNQHNWLAPGSTPASNNEIMLQRRLETEMWSRVNLSAGDRKLVLDEMKKRGITHAPNGMPIEQFVVLAGTYDPWKAADFGDEIPLGSLPETLPVTAPAAVV